MPSGLGGAILKATTAALVREDKCVGVKRVVWDVNMGLYSGSIHGHHGSRGLSCS